MRTSDPLALLLLLAACSSGAPQNEQAANATRAAAETAVNVGEVLEEQPLPPASVDPAAGPAGQDAYTWTDFRAAGGSGFPVLIYGARGNDEVVVNFQCRDPGKTTVLQMRDALAGSRDGPIILSSGDRSVRLEVTLGPDSGDGNTPAAAQLAVAHPVLESLRRTGMLAVTNDGRMRSADAIDAAERATIERFFAACGA